MIRITLSVEGEIVIDRMLQGRENRAQDLRPAWPALVQIFRGVVRRAFDTEGASTGDAWPQLAKRTQRDRARKGFPPQHPILQRTKTLMRSLVIGDSGGFVQMDATALVIGTNVEYFRFHQSRLPRVKLPRRAPVLLTADDRHELFRPIRLYLTGRDPNAPQRSRVA
jgi:phage gpG-like protein